MYIAGLKVPLHLSHNQGVEGIVVASVCTTQLIVAAHARSILKAGKKAGNMKTMPTSLLGRLVTPFHSLVQLIPPATYVVAVAYNSLEQPPWMEDMAFPMEADLAVGVGGKAMIRTLASLALVLWTRYNRVVLNHLGDEWHYIGVRLLSHLHFLPITCVYLRFGRNPKRSSTLDHTRMFGTHYTAAYCFSNSYTSQCSGRMFPASACHLSSARS